MTAISVNIAFSLVICLAAVALSATVNEHRQERIAPKSRFPKAPPPPPPPAVESASVVGGTQASAAIRKRHAYLSIYHGAQRQFFHCGGSIISKRHILTAAHCLFHPSTGALATGVSINLGDSTRHESDALSASALFIHRDYRSTTIRGTAVYYDDVAVLELAEEVSRNDLEVIELARPGDNLPGAGDVVFGVGFGQTSFGGPLSDLLLQVRLRLQSFETCEEAEAAPFKAALSDAVSICATDPGFPTRGGRDTCNGDSGGALYVVRGNGGARTIVQAGITSWASTGCAGVGTVAWYTRLPRYTAAVEALINRGSGPVDSIWRRRG